MVAELKREVFCVAHIHVVFYTPSFDNEVENTLKHQDIFEAHDESTRRNDNVEVS